MIKNKNCKNKPYILIIILLIILLLAMSSCGCHYIRDKETVTESPPEVTEITAVIIKINEDSLIAEPEEKTVTGENVKEIRIAVQNNTEILDIDGGMTDLSELRQGTRVLVYFLDEITNKPLAKIDKCTMIKVLSSAEKETLYIKLTPEQAKEIIDEGEEFILLDVRTEEEYEESRIPGALLIPDFEIEIRVQNEIPDKNTVILVYCRSGRRSEKVSLQLIELGYTSVFDIGGINDWPYEVESGA